MHHMSRKSYFYLLPVLLIITLLVLQGCGQKADSEIELTDDTAGISSSEEGASELPEVSDEVAAGDWKLNPEQSVLTYHASRLSGKGHTGTVSIKEGTMKADGDGITGGSFVIDMTTITESNNNEMYLNHVRSDDFFAVDKHPESRFEITDVALNEDGRYEITGNLTIRGITKRIIFYATATGDGNVLSVHAKFTIDRTRWDIIFDSGSFFQNLGDKAIRDLIEYELDLVFEL